MQEVLQTMARIAGVDLPERKASRNWPHLYLRYRPQVLQTRSSPPPKINPDTRVKDLTEDEEALDP